MLDYSGSLQHSDKAVQTQCRFGYSGAAKNEQTEIQVKTFYEGAWNSISSEDFVPIPDMGVTIVENVLIKQFGNRAKDPGPS